MTTADHNTRRARDLLAMMECIRAFEEQACLAAERDPPVDWTRGGCRQCDVQFQP